MPTEAQLQALVDKDAIREVLYRYSRAIDRHDPDLLRSLYFDDAIDDHGRFVGTADEFANYAMSRMANEFDCTYHTFGSIQIELDGDVAHTETYMFGVHLMKADAERGQLLDVLACRLVDRFERRDGEWRIAHRVVVRDWRHRTDYLDPPGADEFKRGVNNENDVVYQMGALRAALSTTG